MFRSLLMCFAMALCALACALGGAEPQWQHTSERSRMAHFRATATDGRTIVAVGNAMRHLTQGLVYATGDGENWFHTHAHPDAPLHAVACGDGVFVAVGLRGVILRSGNGWMWEQCASPTTLELSAVAWTGSAFVAVGFRGTTVRSTDGRTWSLVASGTNSHLMDITPWNGALVAVGLGGVLIQSDNHGETWVLQSSGRTDDFLACVPVPEGLLIAGAGFHTWNGGGVWSSRPYTEAIDGGILYGPVQRLRTNGDEWMGVNTMGAVIGSADGIRWQYLKSPYLRGRGDAVFVGGSWHLVGSDNAIFKGNSGVTWSPQVSADSSGNFPQATLVHANGRYVSFGSGGSFFVSTDATRWTFGSTGGGIGGTSPDLWRSATARGQTIVAVGNRGRIGVFDSDNLSSNQTFYLQPREHLRGVATSEDRFVAVGDKGTVMVSGEGTNWSQKTGITREDLCSIIWHGNRFIAVSAQGSVFASTDGSTWSRSILKAGAWLQRIRATSSGLVAVGREGVIFTSPDGLVWTERASGINQRLNDIVETSYGLVAVGDRETVTLSLDGGQTWQSDSTASGGHQSFQALHYLNGKLVVVGGRRSQFGRVHFGFSTFPHAFRPSLQGPPSLTAVTGSGGTYVAVGGAGRVIVSESGSEWTSGLSRVDQRLLDVTHGAGVFVAVGGENQDSGGYIIHSSDGIEWELATFDAMWEGELLPGHMEALMSITYAEGRFVACGRSGQVLISEDGKNWRRPATPPASTNHLSKVIHANGRFVAVGDSGSIITSVTGESWSVQLSPTTRRLRTVVWSGSEFWITPFGGDFMLTSPDGLTWQEGPKPNIRLDRHLVSANGGVFAVGPMEFLESTEDGIAWVSHGPTIESNLINQGSHSFILNDLKWLNGHYIAVGSDGYIALSPDAWTWTYVHRHLNHRFRAVKFARDRFIAVGEQILTSLDGARWTKHRSTPYPYYFTDVSDSGSVAVAVGLNAAFISHDLWEWTKVDLPEMDLRAVVWTGSKFIAVAPSGAAVSPNGVDWDVVSMPLQNVSKLATRGDMTVAVGASGIAWSVDGERWIWAVGVANLSMVAWTGSAFVATGTINGYYKSEDGINWSIVFDGGLPLRGLISDGGVSYAFRSEPVNHVYSSTDGLNWSTPGSRLPPFPLHALASSPGGILAFGEDGSVVTGKSGGFLPFADLLLRNGASPSSDLTFTGDSNLDGVPAGLAWYLGIPVHGSSSGSYLQKLPRLEENHAGDLALKFSRIPTPPAFVELVIEQSWDLVQWSEVAKRLPDGRWISDGAILERPSQPDIEVSFTPNESSRSMASLFWRLNARLFPEITK